MPTILLLLILAGSPAFAATGPLPAGAEVSSAPAKAYTVSDIYGGQRFRDPFVPLAGAGARPQLVVESNFNPAEVNIHSLNLKGILRGKTGALAILEDSESGYSFILKNGVLFDYRNRRVPGVTGTVQPRQKTVVLMTPEKDVQTLRLGETEDNAQSKPR